MFFPVNIFISTEDRIADDKRFCFFKIKLVVIFKLLFTFVWQAYQYKSKVLTWNYNTNIRIIVPWSYKKFWQTLINSGYKELIDSLTK